MFYESEQTMFRPPVNIKVNDIFKKLKFIVGSISNQCSEIDLLLSSSLHTQE